MFLRRESLDLTEQNRSTSRFEGQNDDNRESKNSAQKREADSLDKRLKQMQEEYLNPAIKVFSEKSYSQDGGKTETFNDDELLETAVDLDRHSANSLI